MSFKDYCKSNKKFVLAIVLSIVFLYFMVVYNYKSYLYGSFVTNIILYVLIDVTLIGMLIGDFYKQRHYCLECQKEFELEKQYYKNFTLDKLVKLIYDNDILNIELLGYHCNDTEKEEKDFIKMYIKKLIEQEGE